MYSRRIHTGFKVSLNGAYLPMGGGGVSRGSNYIFVHFSYPGRLEQKCTLKMYETSEISRTCVLNANYTII